MKNIDVINKLFTGGMANTEHLKLVGNQLINYSTEIARKVGPDTIELNVRKYSATTSKIQRMIRSAADSNGYKIQEYTGPSARINNWGEY
jgi:hypothetical protein